MAAKRCLIATIPGYTDLLSPTSVDTLALQGGGLSDAESKAFRRFRYAHDVITLRLADDAAKAPGRSVPGIDHWLPTIRALIG